MTTKTIKYVECEVYDDLLESILPKLTKEEIDQLSLYLPRYYFKERKPVQKAFLEHNLIKNLIDSEVFITNKDFIAAILKSSLFEESKNLHIIKGKIVNIEEDLWHDDRFYYYYISLIEENTNENITLVYSDLGVDFLRGVRKYFEKDVTVIARRDTFENLVEHLEEAGKVKNILSLDCILDTCN